MPSPHALFFDIGDTLVFDDPPLPQRFAAAARAQGFAINDALMPQAWRQVEQVGLEAYLSGTDKEDPALQRRSADLALTALRHTPLTDTQWRALGEAFPAVPFVRVVLPQARALLDMLAGRGVRLGVISDWEDDLPDLLEQLDLRRYFETLSVSGIVGHRKPDARLFQDALTQMDVRPADALHIGDWLELDIQGARNVGMPTLLFDHAGRVPDADCPRVETLPGLAAYLEALTDTWKQ